MRELAQRSADAAKEIKTLIRSSGTHVKTGVGFVGETGRALEAIGAEVREIDAHVGAIVASAREQMSGLQEIDKAVGSIDQGTQRNATMVEEATAACHSLAEQTATLNALLRRFDLGQGAGAGSTDAVGRATPKVGRPRLQTAA